MAQSTDQILASRRVLLLSFLVGWTAWYGSFTLQETGIQSVFPPSVNFTLGFVGVIGAIIYTISIMKIVGIRKKYRDDPAALAALTDDLQVRNRNETIRYGFIFLILVQLVMVLFGDILGWSAMVGAHVTIFFGVTMTILAAIWIDMKEG